MAIGVEKTYDPDREKVMNIFLAGLDVEVGPDELRRLSEKNRKQREEEARAKGLEPPSDEDGGHSIFMDYYANKARQHMDKYGSTQRQLAAVASKSHNNSVLNPLAQYTFPVTVEEVLQDREVVWPLTRAMCAPIGDGAAAAVLCSESFLKKRGGGRAVKVLAAVMQSGNRFSETDIASRAAGLGYEAAGVGPKDIDVAEVHDATSYAELYLTEQMGFLPGGRGRGPGRKRGYGLERENSDQPQWRSDFQGASHWGLGAGHDLRTGDPASRGKPVPGRWKIPAWPWSTTAAAPLERRGGHVPDHTRKSEIVLPANIQERAITCRLKPC